MFSQSDAYVDSRQCNTAPHVLITTNVALSYKAAHVAAMLAQAHAYATKYSTYFENSIGPMKSAWK